MDFNVKTLLPHVFDRPIAFHRILAEVAGSVNGGVFLSQAMYWSSIKETNNGWFYKTAEDWEKETFLSRREQETVRRNLVKKKVLEEVKKGIPAKLYFRVNNSELLDAIQKIVQTRMAENAKQDATNPPYSGGVKCETNTETTAETTAETTKDISCDAEFDEFWAAYPKRPNNPKKPAKLKYMAARKRGVSHEEIMQGVKEYAETRVNEDPKFTKLAETWLNKECWQDDYSVYGSKPQQAEDDSQKWLDEIVAAFPGHVGDRAEAAKLISVELSKGVQGKDLWDAARKYKLFCKGPPYEDRKVAPAMLETWLKFKWREMDGYEFCQVGPDRINTVRPKKVKP